MTRAGKKRDGRTRDLSCTWFTRRYGQEWEAWRSYADRWLHAQHAGISHRREAISWFLESYLVRHRLPAAPAGLFAPDIALPDVTAEMAKTIHSEFHGAKQQNHIVSFIDWIIATDFSEPNDQGVPVPLVANPFARIRRRGSAIETVWNALPYVYLRELRTILCPNPQGNFRDWRWAQDQTGRARGKQGAWFEVDSSLIDTEDPDCVWRERTIRRNGRVVTVTQMWSPVLATALLVKLYLPLRTYQIRMLDSGEGDTWRYKQGSWIRNVIHPFALGSEKAPWARGVFRRIRVPDTGDAMTGLYINTNKTADQNKDAAERGYVIPWDHQEVLYWLEKLRNWQEKYNPIDVPTSWTTLLLKHTGALKSHRALKAMGESCFLFRDASARIPEDRTKPILTRSLQHFWYCLLNELEQRVAARDQRLSDGTQLRFTKAYDENVPLFKRVATEFPLHSLRVSLITCYAMEGEVPLPVLSKLLAGHSRLLMTVYYTKITPAVMRDKMAEAESMIDAQAGASLRAFLQDADLRQIKAKTVYRDEGSIEAALANRNPVGWEHRHIGLCLAGGNTVRSDELGTLAGCWNGGELVRDAEDAQQRIHAPVPHGPENCVRCRWFVTDARYLDALRAHFNNLSYRASVAATLAVECEQTREALEDERFRAEQEERPFVGAARLQQAERRYEKQLVEADEFAKDLRACFTLIHRVVAIETGRTEDDDRQKLVAVGALDDLHHPIGLLDIDSELWQLAEICEDAEIYPDLRDDLRKGPAIEKRSRALNTVLMREGYVPVFMQMDEQMQLILGNALMRAMARRVCPEDWRVEGYRRVAGLIEAGRSLREAGLLSTGIEALEHRWHRQVTPLTKLLESQRVPALEAMNER